MTETKNKHALLLLFFSRDTNIVFQNNLTFKIKTLLDALILKETLIDDFYKVRVLEKTKPETIVDIGAGFGDFSIFAARLFPKTTIHAFEPNPHLFSLLEENIKANKVKNIKAYPVAIGQKKEVTLFYSDETTQTTFKEERESQKSIKVKMQSLSDLFSGKRIHFLKMDCEGGEKDIIDSLTNEEKKRIDFISMEYHNFIIPDVLHHIKRNLDDTFQMKIVPNIYNSGFGLLFAKRKQ